MTTAPNAQILDFADFRARRVARDRAASGVQRQFLWKWPVSGQFVAASFPLPAASLYSSNARAR